MGTLFLMVLTAIGTYIYIRSKDIANAKNIELIDGLKEFIARFKSGWDAINKPSSTKPNNNDNSQTSNSSN